MQVANLSQVEDVYVTKIIDSFVPPYVWEPSNRKTLTWKSPLADNRPFRHAVTKWAILIRVDVARAII